MKRVLIWDDFPLENVGGPSGYLYNIQKYVEEFNISQICFLSHIISKKDINPNISNDAKLISRFLVLNKILGVLRLIYEYTWKSFRSKTHVELTYDVLENYSCVHFHKVTHLSQFHARYPKYSGKLILTSHCPCSWTDEMLTRLPSFMKPFRYAIIREECRVYKLADYIMFPCKEAREPYEKIKQIKKVFNSKNSSFFYVPSAIADIRLDSSRIQKLSEIGIPKEAFVIAFFGRHNLIKGYDILKKVGSSLLDKYPNLYFLCAGRGEIEPLQHGRWIELGFIRNTAELLSQCDLYILPNRDTYFDLVLLEILRSGTNTIISETGGNKYFKHFNSEEIKGIDFFIVNSFDSLEAKVRKAIDEKSNTPCEYEERGTKNRSLYENYFTTDKYVYDYLNQINRIL